MKRGTARGALELGALGVVFGDIGTSPLYTVQTVFSPSDPHRIQVSTQNVFGVISLIFWSVVAVVMVTYVLLVMHADNDGEGGIMALITLIRRRSMPSRRRTAVILAVLGVFGASLFFGDSMITPAISVLSAIEGVQVAAPSLASIVLPLTAVILIGLFVLQRLGTAAVGRLFGPVMAIWFAVIAAWGIRGIVSDPAILKALSPTYAGEFLFGHFGTAFFSMAAVVLAVTGAEALYADMGHFGRGPITRAWIFLVFPACILNYLGQGALVLADPAKVSNPFFLLVPSWARIPMVVLAAAATVIASQAVISGAFSLTQQAAQIGYLPRLRIAHTSEERVGQIYVPWINWALLVAVLALVFAFRTATALAYAYGVAVTGTITITTLLFFYIARQQWRRPLWQVIPVAAVLLSLDLLFFAANLTKLPHGAWLPLAIGIIVFIILTTWQKGRAARHPPARARRGIAARVHRPAARQEAATVPGAGHRDLPQPRQGHRPAGHARQRRAQPRAARPRPHPGHPDAPGAPRRGRGPARDRRPRLQGRPDLPRHRALRLHGHPQRPLAAAAHQPGRAGRPAGQRRDLLLPVHHRGAPGKHAGHEQVAQAHLRRHHTAHRRRCRVLPAPTRAHGHHGRPHRALTRATG